MDRGRIDVPDGSFLLSCCISPSSAMLSLVAQMVKNLLATLETRVKSLGREDPL